MIFRASVRPYDCSGVYPHFRRVYRIHGCRLTVCLDDSGSRVSERCFVAPKKDREGSLKRPSKRRWECVCLRYTSRQTKSLFCENREASGEHSWQITTNNSFGFAAEMHRKSRADQTFAETHLPIHSPISFTRRKLLVSLVQTVVSINPCFQNGSSPLGRN